MSDVEVTNSARIAIQQEVDRKLAKYAVLFGIGNFLVILAALYGLWQTIIDPWSEKVERLGGQFTSVETDLNVLSEKTANLSSLIEGFGDTDKILAATSFLKQWDDAENTATVLARLNSQISSTQCEHPRIFTGRTDPQNTNWTAGTGNEAHLYVETNLDQFSSNVSYFTSLGGNRHGQTFGVTSVYNSSSDGFRIYIYPDSDYLPGLNSIDLALEEKWFVNWLAIGC